MSHRIALILMIATAVSTQAADPRVRTRLYDPGAVVTIGGRLGLQTTILFASDERIENIAIGDSAGWQVTPNRGANLLFLKPVAARGRTNMTVVTDRRTYLFDLELGSRNGPPLYTLRFDYPEPPVVTPPTPDPVVTIAVAGAVPSGGSPLDLNFAWTGKGERRLLPQRSFDDGLSVYLAWDRDAALPAILSMGPDGIEGPVNYSMKGDYLVIDGVPDRLMLRTGNAVATLINGAPRGAAVTTPAIRSATR